MNVTNCNYRIKMNMRVFLPKKDKNIRMFFLSRQFNVMRPKKSGEGESMRKRQTHCAFIQQKLSTCLDNELSLPLVAEVEAHLAECARCRKEYSEQKKIWASLAALSVPEPDMRLETGVLWRIAMAEMRPAPRRWFPAPIGAAAFGLFLGIFLASNAVKAPDTLIAPNDGIMQALDAFSPAPNGSFSSAYFVMLNDTAR